MIAISAIFMLFSFKNHHLKFPLFTSKVPPKSSNKDVSRIPPKAVLKAVSSKFLALKRFGKKIRDHIVSGTIFNMKVTLLDSGGDERIPDIQMFSSLGTGGSSVVLGENS